MRGYLDYCQFKIKYIYLLIIMNKFNNKAIRNKSVGIVKKTKEQEKKPTTITNELCNIQFPISPMKACVISSQSQICQKNKNHNERKILSKSPQMPIMDITKSVFQSDEIPIRLSANFEKNTKLDQIDFFNDSEIDNEEDKIIETEYIYNHKIKLTKLLDKGAQALVYLGEIEEIKLPVVIKRYSVENFEQSIIEKIIREAEIVKNMDHENIIKYYALECNLIDKNIGNIDIIMEYFKGTNLKEYVRTSGSLDYRSCKIITKKLLNGLLFLHQNSIIHRDLKPENIIVSSDLTCLKILDFGISTKVKESETFLNRTLTGTAWYMAPEIILSKPYGYEVDIWSLGCIVYEMISGEKPFSDSNQFNAMIKATEYNNPLDYACDLIKDKFYKKENRVLLSFLKECWKTNNTYRCSVEELLKHEFVN